MGICYDNDGKLLDYDNDGKLLYSDNDGEQYVSVQYFLDLLSVSVDRVVQDPQRLLLVLA